MESDIRKTRTCEKCKAVVALDKVRLYPKNSEVNLLLCQPCCEEMKNMAKSRIPGGMPKVLSNQPKASPLTDVSQGRTPEMSFDHKKNVFNRKIDTLPSPDYLKYRCIRCNYFFKIDTSKVGITCNLCCPYCGKADKVEKTNKS